MVDELLVLKNRRDECFVCNLCFGEIKRSRTPKRSQKNEFKKVTFSETLMEEVKRKCISTTNPLDRETWNLNRLESYLLKLFIPFICIACCPRA